MEIQLIRHATFRLNYGSQSLLIDPMLAEKDAMDPIGNAAVQARIPMVELPFPIEQVRSGLTGIIVTHTHRDHWDDAAMETLPKALPTFIQPPDEEKISGDGFTNLIPVSDTHIWEGITLVRTGGKHGTGDLAERLGPVSGFVLSHPDEPKLYIAGDTVWCPEVETALAEHQPDVIVLNAGGAQFLQGDPITMTDKDITLVHQACPNATILPVHLDTINHCIQTRPKLKAALSDDVLAKVKILADGEIIQTA